MYLLTDAIQQRIQQWGIRTGMCYLYVQHTSASLVINESFDPTARIDMEEFMQRLAPEREPWHQHTLEGADDSPSHMRAMVTNTSEMIPIDNGELNLGTWQGVYLFEHRARGQRRNILLRCLEVESTNG